MNGIVSYVLSKKYTDDTVIGMGALKGAPCQVKSINKVDETTTITLEWVDNLDISHTQSFEVKDGKDGISVIDAVINNTGNLILTLSDSSTIDCGKILPQYDIMPTASEENEGKIVQYIGITTLDFTNGYFYMCRETSTGVYGWIQKNVQPSGGGGTGGDGVVDGYYNPADHLFYEESTFVNLVIGDSNTLYTSLDTNLLYRYNGLIFIRVDKIDIDDQLSTVSENPVQNKVIAEKINDLDTLMASKLSLSDVDDALSGTSSNPVQNKVIKLKLDQLQGSVLDKIRKRLNAQEDNFAIWDNSGEVIDSNISKDVIPLLQGSLANAKSDITLLQGSVLNIETDISALQGSLLNKQDKLTKGNGIDIDGSNVISVDMSYLTASRLEVIPNTEKGANNGVATLDDTGKVPSSQLPNYVDDAIEGYLYDSTHFYEEKVIGGYYNSTDGQFYEESTFDTLIIPVEECYYLDIPTGDTYRWDDSSSIYISAIPTQIIGISGKIYISIDTEVLYRWTDSIFKTLGNALQLNEANILGAKNLIPCPYYNASGYSSEGMTTTYDRNGVITINKVAGSSMAYFSIYNDKQIYEPNKKYILSIELENAIDISVSMKDTTSSDFVSLTNKGTGYYETTFTMPSVIAGLLNIYLYCSDEDIETNAKVKVMLRLAEDTDTEYQPYAMTNKQLTHSKVSYEDNAKLGAHNLLPYPYNSTTFTNNGVTFTDNGDGSVTFVTTNEGASANTIFNFEDVSGSGWKPVIGKYIWSIQGLENLADIEDAEVILQTYNGNSLVENLVVMTKDNTSAEININYSNYDRIKAFIIVYSGKIFTTPVRIYPMLRLASDDYDVYTPYVMTNKELTGKVAELANGIQWRNL